MSRLPDDQLCTIVNTILDQIFSQENSLSRPDAKDRTSSKTSVAFNTVLQKTSPNGSSKANGSDPVTMEIKKREMTRGSGLLSEVSNTETRTKIVIDPKRFTGHLLTTVESEKSMIPETGIIDFSNTSATSPSKGSLADGTTSLKINSTDKAGLYNVPKDYDEDFDNSLKATAGVTATINIQPKLMKMPLPPRSLKKRGDVIIGQESRNQSTPGTVIKIAENPEFATLEIEKSNRKDLPQGSGHGRVTTVRPMAAHSTPFKCVTRGTSEIEAPAKGGHFLKSRPKRARIENTPEFKFLKTLFVKDAEKYKEYLLKEKLCRANESANKNVKEYRVVKKLRDWVGQDSYKKFQDHGYFRSKQNAAVEFIDFALNWVNKNVNQTHRVRVSRLVTFIGDMVIGGDVIAISDCTSFGTLFRLDKYTAESDFKDYVACHIHGVVA